MAGSEKTGYENAKPHLIENAYYMLTPGEEVPQETVRAFTAFTASLKAIPMVVDYRQHDFITACVSHLPHLIASSLVELVRDLDSPEELMKQIAAGGFKDITRIASSSPDMWEQICMTNSANILKALEHYQGQLEELRRELLKKDAGGIHSFFAAARDYRNSIPDTLPARWERSTPSTATWWTRPEASPPWPPSSPQAASACATSASSTTVNLKRPSCGWSFTTKRPARRPPPCCGNTATPFMNDKPTGEKENFHEIYKSKKHPGRAFCPRR